MREVVEPVCDKSQQERREEGVSLRVTLEGQGRAREERKDRDVPEREVKMTQL